MRDSNCLISIITPAYNCKKTIAETYESIRNQSFSNWEWIIIEDHSKDETYEFIKTLIFNDEKVILLRTESNCGAAVARNVGIEVARGRYIAFLDSDDMFKEDKLAKQIAFMEANDYAFSFTNYDLLYSNGKIKSHRIKKDYVDYKTLLKSNFIGCLTAMYDSKKIGKVFMPTDCEKREDHGTWLDITKSGITAYRLDESLSIYRIGIKSVSSNKSKMIKYQYRLYRYHEKFGVFKSLYYVLVCSLNKLLKKYW